MYTIVCTNGHERQDARPRGICTECGLHMSVKPEEIKEEEREEEDGRSICQG